MEVPMRSFRMPAVLLAASLAAACAPDASTLLEPGAPLLSRSAQSCQNFTLYLDGWFDTPTTGQGTFTGDMEGTMTFQITEVEQPGNGATFLQFNHTFTTADGSFSTSDIGVLTPSGQFNERMTIVGGTGVYEGASGRITSHGYIDMCTGTGEVTYRGRICT
jgi:hypothetical protein